MNAMGFGNEASARLLPGEYNGSVVNRFGTAAKASACHLRQEQDQCKAIGHERLKLNTERIILPKGALTDDALVRCLTILVTGAANGVMDQLGT
jgi:hypothetical protein